MKKIIIINILLCLLFVSVNASELDKIEFDNKNILNIVYKFNDILLPNTEFEIYKLADIDEDNNQTLTDKFMEYDFAIDTQNVDTWALQADTIYSYILRDNVTKDYMYTTNNIGEINAKLPVGLYLVAGNKLSYNGYTYYAKPCIVTMPFYNEKKSTWDYNLILYPKVYREKEIPEEEKYTSRKIMVVWNDNSNSSSKRPLSLGVKLLQDGEVYDAVSLSASNNWRYVWEKLDAYTSEGEKIIYSIVQDNINDYSVVVDENGSVFSIINTYIEENPVDPGKLPQTGLLWWPIPILFILGILSIMYGIKLNKGKK